MQIAYIVSFIVLFIAQAFTTPTFLKTEIPHPCKKSLFWKMVCSTIFFATAVIAIISTGNHSTFSTLMLVGFFCSWWGDFLLHVSSKPKFFVFGLIAFLLGHLFYISAYTVAMSRYFPEASFIGIPEMIVYIVFICGALVGMNDLKVEFGDAYLPCIAYMCVIVLMVVKAYSFGIRIIAHGATTQPVFTAVMLMLGALLFLLSDFTLSMLTFTKGIEKHGKLRNFNIWTYFFGQMCLALTILFIAA